MGGVFPVLAGDRVAIGSEIEIEHGTGA